jgi:hypothetical protein
MDAYNAYIESCKAPKSQAKVEAIVAAILSLLRKGLTVEQIAFELNQSKMFTIQGKPWNYYSLQMQIGKMARLESNSSLAWGLKVLIETGDAHQDDLLMLRQRTRCLN